MAIKRRILSVLAVALASAGTAGAQTPVDVGGTFQQIGQAANAWIPAIMQISLPTAHTLSTDSISARVSLMNTRALRNSTRGLTNFGEWQVRNRATWLSGADMLASW